jgi:hypothetical protein
MVFEKLKEIFRRKTYRYELMESLGAGSKGGWTTVVMMDTPKKEAYAEHFKPGRLYKLVARDLETGTYAKTVWRHYEPSLIPEKLEEEKPPREERPPPEAPSPAEIMGAWAEGFKEYMEPLKAFRDVIRDVRETLQDISGGTGAQGEAGGIPPLQFEGKAPWIMHPYVVRNIGDTVKDITDHFFGRLEDFRKKAMQGLQPSEAPTPEIQFPSIEEYEETPIEAPPQPTPAEEVKPPTPQLEQPPQPVEEKPSEIAPSAEKPKRGKRKAKPKVEEEPENV